MASAVKKTVEPLPPAPHGFHRVTSVRKVGEAGAVQLVHAKEEELAPIAAFLDLVRIDSLKAEISLHRWRAKGLRLTGRVIADVVQTCVVTLEPVPAHVDAVFERKYLPDDLLGDELDRADVFVDPVGEEPPEPLGHEIDLGAVVVEELSLSLDPYPRKEGSAFDKGAAGEGSTRENPFAALAKLKAKLEPKA